MTDIKLLRAEIDASGVKLKHIAKEMRCGYTRLYSILKGTGRKPNTEEIEAIVNTLHLDRDTRDKIFFATSVTNNNENGN
jgi:predicted transcriptional regulator